MASLLKYKEKFIMQALFWHLFCIKIYFERYIYIVKYIDYKEVKLKEDQK